MFSFWTLVRANLRRGKLRGVVTAGGVAAAVALAFCLLSFQRGYRRGIASELDRLGAHLLVVPKGCPYDAASIALHGASWPCYLKSEYLRTVRRTAHVAVAAPVLMSALYDTGSGAQVVYCGVEPDLLALKRTWRVDGAFPARPGEVMAGAEFARARGWRVGQTVTLPGVEEKTTARVSGILRPTQAADDLFLFLPLAGAQRLFHRPGQLTHILVRLDDTGRSDAVVRDLRGCDAGLEMTVVPLAHLFRTIDQIVQSTRLLLASLALTALLAAGAGVSNAVLMAVSERRREIGVLRALGASPGLVFRLVWAETLVLCLAGGTVGLAGASAGAALFEGWLRARLPYAPDGQLVRPEAAVLLGCLLASAALGSAASLLPAWRAARLAPVEAIRRGSSGGGV
jgi:putative ABC transport system permease protein